MLLLNEAGTFRQGGQINCGRRTETAMTPDKVRRLDALASQLSEALMTAAICAREIHAVVRTLIDSETPIELSRGANGSAHFVQDKQRPLLDESTLSVMWNDKKLHLGHTLSYRLLARLARRPNQYVTHLDLIRDVWDDDDLATATIRSLVRELRRKLRSGGMTDLADAIRGHNGRYILDL
jgi:DNA-binding response OmpR family regulator